MESAFEENLFLLGTELNDLANLHSAWSQHMFGLDEHRGPLFALKHLEKEAREAQQAPHDEEEYADILLLLLDASRRAGFSPLRLLLAAKAKLDKNRSRKWNDQGTDEPVEHVR